MHQEVSAAERGDVTRAERESLARMEYAGGGAIRRGDAASLDGDGGGWRVLGWDLHRDLVIVSRGPRTLRVAPERLEPCGGAR